MKNTHTDIFALSQEYALRLAAGEWTDFLRTAAWNYDFSFVSQLLIYAQKPEATACASYAVWTEKLQRIPRKGTGIALIRDIGDRPRLHYVFDVSDTFVKRGAEASAPPIAIATVQNEPAIRRALIQTYLSSAEGLDNHLQQSPAQFYRSVASALTKEEISHAVQDLLAVQDTCDWRAFTQEEIAKHLEALITESLSFILQIRSGIQNPVVDEHIMKYSQYFNSIEAISVLGTTTQALVRQAVSEITRAVHQWNQNNKEVSSYEDSIFAGRRTSSAQSVSTIPAESEQIRDDAQDVSEKPQTESLHNTHVERGAQPASFGHRNEGTASGGSTDGPSGQRDDRTSTRRHNLYGGVSGRASENRGGRDSAADSLRITDEDIQRAIKVGPPLEGGKYRLYAAATDKRYASDTLAEIIRQEYSTGTRAFMLNSGISGTLSWDASGLHLRREPPFEPNDTTVSWLELAGKLQKLTTDDLYLAPEERHGLDVYFAAQKALEARQRLGETFRVFLAVYSPNPVKTDLKAFQELIRAYAFENSNTARQALLGKLLELRTTIRVETDPAAQEALQELYSQLSVHTPDPHTLPSAMDAGLRLSLSVSEEPFPSPVLEPKSHSLPKSSEELHPGMVLHLPQASYTVIDVSDTEIELESLQTRYFTQSMPKKTLNRILQNAYLKNNLDGLRKTATTPAIPVSPQKTWDIDYTSQTVHTLRTAICSLIGDHYERYLQSIDEKGRVDLPASEDLIRSMESFVGESAIYASEETAAEIETALRTMDMQGALLSFVANKMAQSSDTSCSHVGQEALQILQSMYGLDLSGIESAVRRFGYGVTPEVSKPPRSSEPEIDHPELIRRDLSQDARADKVVLADLLLHLSTYNWTFREKTPVLIPQDAAYREEEFTVVNDLVVTPNVEDNLEHIRQVKSFLTRWFLPFDGIRPEILATQYRLIDAAEQVLENPPEEAQDYIDKHIYIDIDVDGERIDSTGVPDLSSGDLTLWNYEQEDLATEEKTTAEISEVVKNQPEIAARINYRTTDMHPHYGGPKQRFQNNLAAIRLLKQLEQDGRLANQAEQDVLSKYVGWGGLPNAFDPKATGWEAEYQQLKELLTEEEYKAARASTLTAFYTPPVVIKAMYDGLKQLGVSSGNILDAGCGTGAFFGQAPKNATLYGVEIDSITGRIARQLYQQAQIEIEGFENTKLPDHFFQAMIGNVPFGNFKVFDPKYNSQNFQIHDYFFAKGLDKVQSGGVLALITSAGTLDKQDEKFRRYLAQRADLIGAIRLPNDTFRENAGTDVTADILFLRKRSGPQTEIPEWVELDTVQEKDGSTHFINTYFAKHPEMILGEMTEVSGPYGKQLVCVPKEDQSLEVLLPEALDKIYDDSSMTYEDVSDPLGEGYDTLPADPAVPNYSFTLIDDVVYYREDAQMFRVDTGKLQVGRIQGMIELRNTLRELIRVQQEDSTDHRIKSLQKLLNTQYDSFVEKYGRINSRANKMVFSDDSSYYLLCSLEVLDKNRQFVEKADIFSKRTIAARKAIIHVDTPYEALVVSIGERGSIDFSFMEQLSGFSKEELLDGLHGQIFENPSQPGTYMLSASYLSGNILEKLKQAKAAEALQPGQFSDNIQALEKAMPEPVGPGEISLRLGATWVPPDIIRDFMYETFRTKGYNQGRKYLDVDYSRLLNMWSIKNKALESNSLEARSKYGTTRMDAYTILEHTLNLKDVRVYDKNQNGKQIINIQETVAAQEKQEAIRNAFLSWVWKDPVRSKRLCKIYNKKFNCYKSPEYDGNILTFHGKSPLIELRKNQKDVIARILFNGNTQIAASVGAGKTWMMTAAAMEGKHLGLCSKSMIAVPNHLVGQWTSAIYELYPAARVLAVTKKDFEPARRKRFCSRIATGDYDIVVIGHSQLEKIPLSSKRQAKYIQEQIDEIVEGIAELKENSDSPFTVKQLEAKKTTLVNKMRKLTESKQKDNVVTFEDLGVDRLFVDESDEFKNLYLYTKMQNVAGLAQTDAQKASDLFLKCRYLDELTGKKGNIHATGTPVSNTMAEIYTTQRYLQYDTLKEIGVHNFDAWASSFAEAKPVLELAPEGTGYRMRNRLTNFYNLPELMGIYRQVAEIQTHDTLNLPLPQVHYITKSLPASPEQLEMVQDAARRAEAIRNGEVRPEEDNMLCVINDGRKLALDQRLMNPDLSDHPNSKINAAAESIYKQWLDGTDQKLTQLVFCDLSTPKDGQFNVYDALKDKLVEKGIPAEEIRFIHDAKTDVQKDALFSQVRDGSVRILMGSTIKMGTGTNVQDLLVAGHHLDCPWRPRDMTQQDGRIIRIGNLNSDVYIYRYVTEGTFDAYMYQLLESKQRMISQVFTSKTPARQIEDLDQMAMSFAEIKGIASGNPLVKERVELQLEISKLEMLRNKYIQDHARMEKEVSTTLPLQITNHKHLLARLAKDCAKIKDLPSRTEDGKYLPILVDGQAFQTATESGNALLNAMEHLSADRGEVKVGSYRGFDLIASKDKAHPEQPATLYVKGEGTYPVSYSENGFGIVRKLNHFLESIVPQRFTDCKTRINNLEDRILEYQQELDQPFSRANELQEKAIRLKNLDLQLNMDLNNQYPFKDLATPGNNVPTFPSLDERLFQAQILAGSKQENQVSRQSELRI